MPYSAWVLNRITFPNHDHDLEYIERGITHNKEDKLLSGKYPFLEDPKEALSDNRKQAIAYHISLEKKLQWTGFKEKFLKNATSS